jgi:hypothetical protein
MVETNNPSNKRISAYVDIKTYKLFTEINKKRNLSNNKALNVLIADYVLQYKKYL